MCSWKYICVHTTNNEDVLCGVENIFCVHTTNNEDDVCGSWKYILCTHN